MSEPIYGELEPVAKLKGHDLVYDAIDPTGRYASYRNGLNVIVLDLAPDVPEEVARHRDATSTNRKCAISPDGRGIAIRNTLEQTLRVVFSDGTEVKRTTGTTLTDWQGNVLPTRSPRPQWGYGFEAVAWGPEGRYVALATHLPIGQACIQLYDTHDDLEVVDAQIDFPLLSAYARIPGAPADAPTPRMTSWGESWLEQDPLEPGLLLGVRNAGDSCLGVMAIRNIDGRLEPVDPIGLGTSVFQVDDYALRGLRRTPAGILVLDRDYQMGLVSWPPDPQAGVVVSRYVGDHLSPEGEWGIRLPWLERGGFEADDLLTVTEDHLLATVADPQDYRTEALIAYDHGLEPLGLVRRPKSRLRFTMLRPLGRDLFAGVGSATIQLWRLRR